jgi:hypothetical protein
MQKLHKKGFMERTTVATLNGSALTVRWHGDLPGSWLGDGSVFHRMTLASE